MLPAEIGDLCSDRNIQPKIRGLKQEEGNATATTALLLLCSGYQRCSQKLPCRAELVRSLTSKQSAEALLAMNTREKHCHPRSHTVPIGQMLSGNDNSHIPLFLPDRILYTVLGKVGV